MTDGDMSQVKHISSREVIFQDLDNIPFDKAWALQERLLQDNTQIKLQQRLGKLSHDVVTTNYLLFCEHPHVYTLGKSGAETNLLLDEAAMSQRGVSFVRINRGGDITYHGPGQLVAYPIWDLDHFKTDLHWYLRSLEEAIIQVCAHYGIQGGRVEGATGVWVDVDTPIPRKICAMGIRCSRWVTMHGLALNVNTDLTYFQGIVPCGIQDKGVTSLAAELGRGVDLEEVKGLLKQALAKVFGYEY
ncbi:MAG: lipoyl(octanoyl) transferase LipB, partial [Bacteroidota bacterium]